METVLDALKAMGKATYREVAARLDIEPVTALTMLREQKELGLCDFCDGGWSLGMAKKTKPAAVSKKSKGPVAPVDPDVVVQHLRTNGKTDTAALSTVLGRNFHATDSAMRSLVKKGLVVKNGENEGITWSLLVQQQPESPAPEASADKSTSEIVQDIPAFTARADDLVIPSTRFISGEIRRTRAKLANLEKLRDAVRSIRKHGALVQELAQ